MNANDDFNPLLARRNRSRGIVISALAAFGLLAAGTLAVSAAQSQGQSPQKPQAVAAAQASEIRTASAEQGAQPRRQVRVIPLFNTPGNQTGK